MSGERTRLDATERHAQLVALAVSSLAERPLSALTIPALARDAGVSRALLFHYFGSHDGLHRIVLETARDAMLHATEPVRTLPPRDRLRDTLHRTVSFVRDHGGTFASLVRGVASTDPEAREIIDQARQAQADRVVAVFVEQGAADTVHLRRVARGWIAFAEELLVGVARGEAPGDEALVDYLVRSAEAAVAALQEPAGTA